MKVIIKTLSQSAVIPTLLSNEIQSVDLYTVEYCEIGACGTIEISTNICIDWSKNENPQYCYSK
jgi:hypothetical protein